jgi:DNA replication and repair protein RecF
MTVVRSLSVKNFRSHLEKTIELSKNNTVITGLNGSGKTSLLEAVYLALQGTSFKGTDTDIVNYEADWWSIQAEFDNDIKRRISFDSTKENKRKKFVIDDKTLYRLTPKYKHPVVLFEPNDLRLIHSSPNSRRSFVDRLAAQINPSYITVLNKYERALKQRNNLLKNKISNQDSLFAWDVAIAEKGAYIINQRISVVEELNQLINQTYQTIADNNDSISIHYSHTYIGDVKQKILNDLEKNKDQDLIYGFTSVGPHRHDIVFYINDHTAQSVASRGEVRTIVLSMKLLEAKIINKIVGQKPIILMDDVFSELDEKRQKLLSETIRDHQIIITSAHYPSTDKSFYHIEI